VRSIENIDFDTSYIDFLEMFHPGFKPSVRWRPSDFARAHNIYEDVSEPESANDILERVSRKASFAELFLEPV